MPKTCLTCLEPLPPDREKFCNNGCQGLYKHIKDTDHIMEQHTPHVKKVKKEFRKRLTAA